MCIYIHLQLTSLLRQWSGSRKKPRFLKAKRNQKHQQHIAERSTVLFKCHATIKIGKCQLSKPWEVTHPVPAESEEEYRQTVISSGRRHQFSIITQKIQMTGISRCFICAIQTCWYTTEKVVRSKGDEWTGCPDSPKNTFFFFLIGATTGERTGSLNHDLRNPVFEN